MPSSPFAELDAFVGGYMGDSYGVHLDGAVLRYEHLAPGYEPLVEYDVSPSAELWVAFVRKVDRIDLWNWEPRYADDSVMDGASWSIRLADGTRRVESMGSNSAPPGFCEFCAATSRLVRAPFL